MTESDKARQERLAAGRGNGIAQLNLGIMYATGRRVTKDDVKAVHWYRLSADQGHALAQCNLAVRYATGRGGPVSTPLARTVTGGSFGACANRAATGRNR